MSSAWTFEGQLEPVDPNILRYGSGFLSSKPENWIPNFSAFWAPLVDLLNFEISVLEIQPSFDFPQNIKNFWLGSFGDQKVAIYCDPFVAKYLASLFVPDIDGEASNILEDYLARRFLKSLATAWSGPSLHKFQYLGLSKETEFKPFAGVRITLSLNGRQIQLWLMMEEPLLENLDNLWRRQTTTFNVKKLKPRPYQIDLYHQVVVLEQLEGLLAVSNKIYLKNFDWNYLNLKNLEYQSVAKVKLMNTNKQLVIQVVEPEIDLVASSRDLILTVSFPSFTLSAEQALLTNIGAFLGTGLPLDTGLVIQVSGETVAQAKIGQDSQGFFAQIIS